MRTLPATLQALAPRIRFPLAVFATTRVAYLLVAGWGLTIDPRLHRGAGPTPLPALKGLCRWDCGWYLSIAEGGYATEAHSNFFPLFPLLGRAVAALTSLPTAFALLLVANLASLLGLCVVYRLFFQLEGEAAARTALLLLAAWPFSFFQAAGYTEGLMLLGTSATLWLALRGRHLGAGAALGLTALARHLSLSAGLALLTAQWLERPSPGRFLRSPALFGLLLPLLLFALYPAFLAWRFGSPATFVSVHRGEWAPHGAWRFFAHPWPPEIGYYLLLSLALVVGALCLLARRRWWVLAGFAAPYTLAVWAVGLPALGRYMALCWPAFLPLGAFLARRPALQWPVITSLAVLQGMFLFLFTHSYPIN